MKGIILGILAMLLLFGGCQTAQVDRHVDVGSMHIEGGTRAGYNLRPVGSA